MFDQLIIFCAQYLPFLIVAVALWFILRLEISRRKSALGLMVFGSAIAFALDKILNQIIVSPRPFVIEDIAPLFPHVADNGFPSEHVLFAVLIANIVFVYNRKLGITLGILALIIGLARIAANVHHLIDVLGGTVIAIVSVLIAWHVISLPKVQSLLRVKNGEKPLF